MQTFSQTIEIPTLGQINNNINLYQRIDGHINTQGRTAGEEKNPAYLRDNILNIVCAHDVITAINQNDWIISSNYTWYPTMNGYIATTIHQPNQPDKILYLHHLILNYHTPKPISPIKLSVDHKNRNKLDNRLENLRWATQSLQNSNQNDRIRTTVLPPSLSVHIYPLIQLPKYIGVRLNDMGTNCVFRDYFEIEEHPTLKRCGKRRIASSKVSADKMSLVEKYDQIMSIYQLLNNRPTITAKELDRCVYRIKHDSDEEFIPPPHFKTDAKDPRGKHVMTFEKRKYNGTDERWNLKLQYDENLSQIENYKLLLVKLRQKYKNDAVFIEYLNTLPTYENNESNDSDSDNDNDNNDDENLQEVQTQITQSNPYQSLIDNGINIADLTIEIIDILIDQLNLLKSTLVNNQETDETEKIAELTVQSTVKPIVQAVVQPIVQPIVSIYEDGFEYPEPFRVTEKELIHDRHIQEVRFNTKHVIDFTIPKKQNFMNCLKHKWIPRWSLEEYPYCPLYTIYREYYDEIKSQMVGVFELTPGTGFVLCDNDTRIKFDKHINGFEKRPYMKRPYQNLHPDPNLNLKCNFDSLVRELITKYGDTTNYFNQFQNLPPIVEPIVQPTVQPTVQQPVQQTKLPEHWNFSRGGLSLSYQRVKGDERYTSQTKYDKSISLEANIKRAINELLNKYPEESKTSPLLKIYKDSKGQIILYPKDEKPVVVEDGFTLDRHPEIKHDKTRNELRYDKRGKEGKERPKFYKKMVLKDGLNLRQNYELFMSELLEKCKNEPQYDEYLKKYETSTIQEDIIVDTNNSIIHQTKDDSDAIKRRKPRKQ